MDGFTVNCKKHKLLHFANVTLQNLLISKFKLHKCVHLRELIKNYIYGEFSFSRFNPQLSCL